MPLPATFSPFEHLQDTIRQAVNRQVRFEFDDIDIDDDISTPRGSLRVACLHTDKDSAMMMIIRLLLYYVVVKGFGCPEIYSIPLSQVNEGLRYKPQIHLHFIEPFRLVQEGETPIDSQIKGIRLMGETNEGITQADALRYAQRIKTLFGAGNGFTWKRGKNMFTYSDMEKGYNMQLLVFNLAEGKRIVEQVLDIQGHTPDWEKGNYKENLEPLQAFPAIPPRKNRLSKSVKQKRKRPVTTINFQWAQLHVEGLPKPVVLYDKSGAYKSPLVRD
jgi:hypothetical protein